MFGFVDANKLNLKLYKKQRSTIVLNKEEEENSTYQISKTFFKVIVIESARHWYRKRQADQERASTRRHFISEGGGPTPEWGKRNYIKAGINTTGYPYRRKLNLTSSLHIQDSVSSRLYVKFQNF